MRSVLFFLAILSAGPALADTTAVYETPDKVFKMTIEVADNGDLRGAVAARPGMYFLTLAGQSYIVLPTKTGLVADRLDDVVDALKIVVAEKMPQMQQMFDSMNKYPKTKVQLTFAKGQQLVISGRRGTPYYLSARQVDQGTPVMVISSDPELAPIGAAMARQNEMSARLQPFAIHDSSFDSFEGQVAAALNSGAPLAVGTVELTTVSHDPIAPERFRLPGPLESRDAIIRRIRANATSTSVTAF